MSRMHTETRQPLNIEPSVLRLTLSTQSARVLARRLVLAALVLIALLALAPWQQSLPGHGRVIAYAPLDRQQALEAPMDGRVTNRKPFAMPTKCWCGCVSTGSSRLVKMCWP